MKRIINNLNCGILFISLIVLLGFGCANDDDAPPVIERVRPTDAALADSSMVEALPGTFLVIEGRNLDNTIQVLFNNYEAYFNVAFNTNTHLIVQIPMKTPTPDKDPSVPNTITVTTPAGQAVYSFAINPPAPVIQSVYNENTKPGEVMVITGEFLLGVEEVVFPGDKKGTNIEKDEEGTELHVMVPSDLTETGNLTLLSPYGNTTYPFIVNNTAGDGVFANFEEGTPSDGWGYWGSIKTDDASLFPNNYGTYLRSLFSGVGPGDGGWWANNRVLKVMNYDKVIVPSSELSNKPDPYYLKFEINTRVPITTAATFLLGFKFSENDNAKIEAYFVPALNEPDQILDTENKWKTLSFPMKELGKFNWDSSWSVVESIDKISTIGNAMEDNGAVGKFHLAIITRDAGGIDNFDAAFDNFRIEKVQE